MNKTGKCDGCGSWGILSPRHDMAPCEPMVHLCAACWLEEPDEDDLELVVGDDATTTKETTT